MSAAVSCRPVCPCCLHCPSPRCSGGRGGPSCSVPRGRSAVRVRPPDPGPALGGGGRSRVVTAPLPRAEPRPRCGAPRPPLRPLSAARRAGDLDSVGKHGPAAWRRCRPVDDSSQCLRLAPRAGCGRRLRSRPAAPAARTCTEAR